MKTLYLFYTIFFLALTACATSQKEEPTTVLAHQTVEIKNDYIGMAIQLLIVGDRLYGADMLTDTLHRNGYSTFNRGRPSLWSRHADRYMSFLYRFDEK